MNRRKSLVLAVFVVSVMVMMQITPVMASYMFWKSDSTGYPHGDEWASGDWLNSYDKSSGEALVLGGGFGNAATWWGMSFTPTESGDCYFGVAWSLSYGLKAGPWPFGVSRITVSYRLTDNDAVEPNSFVILEGHNVVIYSAYNGQYNKGQVSRSEDQDVLFRYSLVQGTTYRIWIYVVWYINWWSIIEGYSGGKAAFDVMSMTVSSGPISD
jgi:hypothetical protein